MVAMTLGEMRNEMGEAAEELSELRKRRACLLTKTERIRRVLEGAESRLDCAAKSMGNVHHNTAINPADWPSFDEVLAVVNDLAEADARILTLETRLREWGVIS